MLLLPYIVVFSYVCCFMWSFSNPGDKTAFIELLLRDSGKMGSEMQNKLSKINMLVLLLLNQYTPVRFMRAEPPLK